MVIRELQKILDATLLTPEADLGKEVKTACGSDMMSEVLAFVKDQAVLLTGLNNPQVIRTADMMNMACVVFVRGKMPDRSIVAMAQERGIALLSTRRAMFSACGLLWENGLRGGRNTHDVDEPQV